MRWCWVLFCAFILGWLLDPAAVYAQTPIPHDHCTCQTNGAVSGYFNQAEAVFAGKVLALSRPNDAPSLVEWANRLPGIYIPGYSYWRADVAVSDSWKGMNETGLTVLSSFGLNCGVRFTVGVDYLIYATDSPVGWRTSTCAGTVELADAAPDLQFLSAYPKLQLSWPLQWQLLLGSVALALGITVWAGWRLVKRQMVSFEH
jgi:hypothetical protein